MSKTQIKSNDAEKTQDGIQKLLKEAITFKRIIQKQLKADPDNLAEHRIYCTYVRRTLEIYKTMIQAQSIDPELISISVLKCVVLTLFEKGEGQAAEVVGRHLEAIGEKVRGQWQDYKEPGKAIMKSEPSSNRRSPPSETNRPGKSKNASNAP
jgi:hypothetical protein